MDRARVNAFMGKMYSFSCATFVFIVMDWGFGLSDCWLVVVLHKRNGFKLHYTSIMLVITSAR